MFDFKNPDGDRHKWILTSNKLPSLNGDYLITYRRNYLKDNLVCLSRFENGFFDIKDATIIAWRHIPYPYIE